MAFEPPSERSPEDIPDHVASLIDEHDVVLFMKGSPLMPQCGYSRRALGLLQQYRDDLETVDVLPALDAYRDALEAHSGWRTIPQAYVDGDFIGGSDVLAEMEERGDLASTLET